MLRNARTSGELAPVLFTSMIGGWIAASQIAMLAATDSRSARVVRCAMVVLCIESFLGVAPAAAQACGDLAKLTLRDAKITSSSVVPAGAFTAPGGRGGGATQAYARLPEFCRVAATLTPSNDSDIKIEVWLPTIGWNGKFQAVGNGGWAGSIPYPALATALGSGYATAATDTGHTGNTAAFALDHPEKVIDFGYRAVHEMTVQTKALIGALYRSGPKLSIWNGCSQGGKQGITEALRFPGDYDGVIAGAPVVNWMHLQIGRVVLNRLVNRTPASGIPREQYALVHKKVLEACDAADGVVDGVLENPMACHFDPSVLQCNGKNGDACLTPAQVESVRSLYAPVLHPHTGAEVVPRLVPGAELEWAAAAATEPLSSAVDAFKYVVFKDPNWTDARFNAATDIERALQADADDVLGTTSTDLKAFLDRGGKLFLYHGWSDSYVTPLNSMNYVNAVAKRFGTAVIGRSIELYMVPGMNHCQGGPGTDVFDEVAALEEWIKTGTAPRRILASHQTNGIVDRTRPLCPSGEVARWNGSGSTNDASSFVCAPSAVPVQPGR